MEWIINNAGTIFFLLWVADQVAAATPETLKIGNFPIGKYDNIVVGFAKTVLKRLVTKKI